MSVEEQIFYLLIGAILLAVQIIVWSNIIKSGKNSELIYRLLKKEFERREDKEIKTDKAKFYTDDELKDFTQRMQDKQ